LLFWGPRGGPLSDTERSKAKGSVF